MTGDRIFGFRLAYGLNLDFFGHEISKKIKDPERFDIVIFKYPDDESKLFIKRVIGLPGEKVQIKDGKVYINDSEIPLDDSFVPEKPRGSFGPYEVPENSYFVLGDNRNHSKDSRCWNSTSFVTFDEIVGMAGASADSPYLWQIGINVNKEFEGRHIASGLVSILKRDNMEKDIVPYYGTSFSNLASQHVAAKAGFEVAWVELITE